MLAYNAYESCQSVAYVECREPRQLLLESSMPGNDQKNGTLGCGESSGINGLK